MSPKKQSTEDSRVKIFIHEYVQDFNATRAYVAAGYSEKGANGAASRLLANVSIRERVAKLIQARCDELLITKQRVLRETALLAFSNAADYMDIDDNGEATGIDFSRLTRDQAAAIQEIREDSTGGTGDGERKRIVRTTLKLANKRDSLELLGKHLGMFKDQVEHTGADGAPLAVTINFVKP